MLALLVQILTQQGEHLTRQGVTTTLYAMWVSLMLSQEFRLPDVRLWDRIFSQGADQRIVFLLHIFCAMVLRLKDELLVGDFSDNLQRLQAYPRDLDVEELIYQAKRLESVTLLPSPNKKRT